MSKLCTYLQNGISLPSWETINIAIFVRNFADINQRLQCTTVSPIVSLDGASCTPGARI